MSDPISRTSPVGAPPRDAASAGKTVADVMIEAFDADGSGDLTRQELSDARYDFDQAQFSRIAKDDRMSREDLMAYVAAQPPADAAHLAERAERFKGLVERDRQALDAFRAEPALKRLLSTLHEALMVAPDQHRARQLPEKLANTRALGARMLGEWLRPER